MDLTVKLLEEIRDAVRDTNRNLGDRIDQTNARLDQTNERLSSLENKVTGVEIRVSTSMMEIASSLGQLKDLYSDRFDLRGRVERCEVAIEELKSKPDR